jgi:hypothetical protein
VTIRGLSFGRERFKAVLSRLDADLEQADFGDPATGTTRYDLCLYDESNTLALELTVDRAAQTCGDSSKACWVTISAEGYRYKDRHASADGVKRIVVKGGRAGRGKVVLRAGNDAAKGQLSFPAGATAAFEGATAVTVQLVTSDGACFGGTITDVSRADLRTFRASGPVVP